VAGWGTGSFENEDAQSFLGRLKTLGVADLQQILSRAADDADYLEAPASSVAVAAAEVIAALKGAPTGVLPREIAAWTSAAQAQSSPAAIPELAGLAIRAVDRVRTNSELKDLWLEADGLNEWSASLRDLTARLSG